MVKTKQSKAKKPKEKSKNKYVTFALNFTTSKFMAYAIFVVGSTYAFLFKDANVLMATFAAASAVLATKTYTTSKERQKQMEFDPNFYENDYNGYSDTNNNEEAESIQPAPQNNIIIISDDNSSKLEVKPQELNTLINSGYVQKIQGRYVFKKNQKEQIVSLIDGAELKEQGIYSEEETAI